MQKPPKDTNQLAKYIIDVTTGDREKIVRPEKDVKFQELSELGASKGGNARAAKLTPKERSDIAQKAAKIRWKQD